MRPKYINAGYEAIEDKFGDYSLKMVYIPGTNGEKWIGDKKEWSAIPVSKDGTISASVNGWQNTGTGTVQADGNQISTSIPATYACEFFPTREFINKIKAIPGVTSSTYGGTISDGNDSRYAKISVTHPKTGTKTFNFTHRDILSTGQPDGSIGGLYNPSGNYNHSAWGFFSPRDAVIAANVLTAIWNALNPGQTQLTYAYTFSDGTPLTGFDSTVHHNYFSNNVVKINANATGYRCVYDDLYNYYSHIITDERQVPRVSTKPSGYAYELVKKKSDTGKNFSYKNSYDGNTLTDYYGSAAGLSYYDSTTGTYDRNRLRKGFEAQGKPSSTASRDFALKDIYSMYNIRNGAGLFGMQGLYNIIMPEYYTKVRATTYKQWTIINDPWGGNNYYYDTFYSWARNDVNSRYYGNDILNFKGIKSYGRDFERYSYVDYYYFKSNSPGWVGNEAKSSVTRTCAGFGCQTSYYYYHNDKHNYYNIKVKVEKKYDTSWYYEDYGLPNQNWQRVDEDNKYVLPNGYTKSTWFYRLAK